MKKESFLKQFFTKIQNHKLRYGLLIIVLGIFLLTISNLFSTDENDKHLSKESHIQNDDKKSIEQKFLNEMNTIATIEKSYEAELEKMLNEINGISEIEVMINLDSTEQQQFEKNLIIGKQITDESDTNGGTRTIEDETEETEAVLIRQGDEEVPLLVQTKKPKVRGVFVVGKGVEDIEKKNWVVQSVSKVLDVPTHKISVVQK